MKQSTTPSSIRPRSFSPALRTTLTTGFAVAALLAASIGACAQAGAPSTAVPPATDPTTPVTAPATPDAGAPAQAGSQPAATQNVNISNQKTAKTRKQKEEKVVESKDTKKEDKKTKRDDALVGVDTKLPDKALFDKAKEAAKKGHYDVARLLLQDLLNTYPDSQYLMSAKLAIADSWYKEGGTAALTQAEQEYKDFITFFPNAPEAAEAQMRVGDIYFREMDKPDRDNTATIKAEQEYRLMLQQFPDSVLAPQSKLRLREVQEVLASREASVAAFYATRMNWAAVIARYQTVVDTYPLYSHMDDVLIGLGDAYETEAHFYRDAKMPNLPAASRERLISIYERKAAAAWTKVVLEHSAAPHVEDARDRLVALGLPVPTPTAEQAAASAALENSRGQYTLSKRAIGFFMHQADTVPAATIGEPPLEDPKPTLAPTVFHQSIETFNSAVVNPSGNAAQPAVAAALSATPAADNAAPAPAAAAPLAFQNLPSATAGSGGGSTVDTSVPLASPSNSSAGTGMGIEIVQPAAGSSQAPITPPAAPPAFPGTNGAAPAAAQPAPAVDYTKGLTPAASPDSTPLPAVEKPAVLPDAINDAAGQAQPAAQAPPANGKKVKPACDKSEESCSKHKPKKGLDKLNPF